MNRLRIFTSVLFRPVSHTLWTFLIAFIVSEFFFFVFFFVQVVIAKEKNIGTDDG